MKITYTLNGVRMETGEIIYNVKIVGVSFEPAKTNLKNAVNYFQRLDNECNPIMTLKAEPSNPHDKNAIQVWIEQNNQSWNIGYIPKIINQKILEIGIHNIGIKLVQFNQDYKGDICGATINI